MFRKSKDSCDVLQAPSVQARKRVGGIENQRHKKEAPRGSFLLTFKIVRFTKFGKFEALVAVEGHADGPCIDKEKQWTIV